MAARVPLDVDLEDKLLYGLTPIRLGYVVVGLLIAFSLWSGRWCAPTLRGTLAVVVCVLAAAAGWGRWRGRAVDAWVIDAAQFVIANYRVARRRRGT